MKAREDSESDLDGEEELDKELEIGLDRKSEPCFHGFSMVFVSTLNAFDGIWMDLGARQAVWGSRT